MRRNWLEWVTLTISSVVVVSTFAYLIWLAVATDHREASLSVHIGQVTQSEDLFEVALIVRNEGDKTAENVQVVATLKDSGGNEEKAEVMIHYVPYHTERKATAVFRTDPRGQQLTAVARAYARP